MSNRANRRWSLESVVTWIAVLGAFGWFGAHEWAVKKQDAADQTRRELKREQTQMAIDTLVRSTNAIEDWSTALCAKAGSGVTVTADFQDALQNAGSRPLLISGDLEDVRSENGQYILSLKSDLCRGAQIRVEAITDQTETAYVLSHRSTRPAYFHVVVQPASVKERTGKTRSDEADDSDDDLDAHTFVLRGKCVQVLFTGSDGFFLELHRRYRLPR